MHSVLEKIIGTKRQGVDRSKAYRQSLEERLNHLQRPGDFIASLQEPGRRIIAEVKRSSPSEGQLRSNVNPTQLANDYQLAGAAAISVLTEESYFGGSLDDLTRVSERVRIPCLRKDFIVDEIQILEARIAGASAILLIVAALNDAELQHLMGVAQQLGLASLVEVHTREELARAEQAGAKLIGVNNRNLHTLEIDLHVSERLRPYIGHDVTPIAESGIHELAHLQRLEDAGYTCFLIGSTLMKAPEPGLWLRSLIQDTDP
jgi:indole-3-glycerol phosphate synthase